MDCRFTHKIAEAIENANIISLLRIQHERWRKTLFSGSDEYIALLGRTKQRLEKTKPDVLIMHSGPINRGVVIDRQLADGSKSNATMASAAAHPMARRL